MMRSSAPDRWVVAAADHQRLHTVVKVGRNDRGSARERAALSTLRSTPAVTLPEILGYHEEGGWRALAAAALPRTEQLLLESLPHVHRAHLQGAVRSRLQTSTCHSLGLLEGTFEVLLQVYSNARASFRPEG